MTAFTDHELEIIGAKAAQKILETDDWDDQALGYDPMLRHAMPDLILPSGRRISVRAVVHIIDHDPIP